MSSKNRRKQIDRSQCQICGDYQGKIYSSGVTVLLQVHHIIPRYEGGRNRIDNLITLCYLCHAVVTPQRWREYFGEKGTYQNMEPIQKAFNEYLTSNSEERGIRKLGKYSRQTLVRIFNSSNVF